MTAVTGHPLSVHPNALQPVWDVALLYPAQGCWSQGDYLALDTNLRVEFDRGIVEFQDMPTQWHQFIIAHVFTRLAAHTREMGSGVTLFAGIRVQLWPGKFREPDLVFMLEAHEDRRGEQFWIGADLVMEVVSDDRDRDLVIKRAEYAKAGIVEYWIIDPAQRRILVLGLRGEHYQEMGVYSEGMTARSVLLPGFTVTVDEVLAAGR